MPAQHFWAKLETEFPKIAKEIVLDRKKARGTAVGVWCNLENTVQCRGVEHVYNQARTYFKENY